jgi:hypothetical protein
MNSPHPSIWFLLGVSMRSIALFLFVLFCASGSAGAQTEKATLKRSDIEKLSQVDGVRLLVDVWASRSTSIKTREVISANNYFYPVPPYMDYATVEGAVNWTLPFAICEVEMLTFRFEPANPTDKNQADPELKPTTMSVQRRYSAAAPNLAPPAPCAAASGSFYFTAEDGALAKNALDAHRQMMAVVKDGSYSNDVVCKSDYGIKENVCPNLQKLMAMFTSFDAVHSKNAMNRNMDIQFSKRCGEITAMIEAKIEQEKIVAISFARFDFRKNSFLQPPTDLCLP